MVEHMVEPPRLLRRLEVITGAGGRRRWSAAEKERITAEAMMPGAVVSEIARRHGMSPQHLFTWRRQARQGSGSARELPAFVPAVIDPPAARPIVEPRARRARRRSSSSEIELEIDGVAVRVGSDASAKAISAVIRALKAGS